MKALKQDRVIEEMESLMDETRLLFHRMKVTAEQLHGPEQITAGMRGVLFGLAHSGPRTVPQMAKARPVEGRSQEGAIQGLERLYKPNRKNPILLKPGSPETNLLVAIRDEAHRFAVTYHRTLKQRLDFESDLDGIPGVGERKKRALLAHFKDMAAIRSATVEALSRVEGLSRRDAEAIHHRFRS